MICVNITSNIFETNNFEYNESDTLQTIRDDITNGIELRDDDNELIDNSTLLFTLKYKDTEILEDTFNTLLSELLNDEDKEINIYVEISYKDEYEDEDEGEDDGDIEVDDEDGDGCIDSSNETSDSGFFSGIGSYIGASVGAMSLMQTSAVVTRGIAARSAPLSMHAPIGKPKKKKKKHNKDINSMHCYINMNNKRKNKIF